MKSSRSKVRSLPYLFARSTEDLKIVNRVAYFLQECRLSRIGPPFDEGSKIFALATGSVVHDSW